MLSHEDSDAADHAHSRAVVTVTWPEPPDAGTGVSGGVTETAHFEPGVGAVMLVVADEPQAAATMASTTMTAAAAIPERQREESMKK